MKRSSRHVIAGLALAALGVAAQAQPPGHASGLVAEVRAATRDFHDVGVAVGAGYASAGSCVSGPQAGAMGIHYPMARWWATACSMLGVRRS